MSSTDRCGFVASHNSGSRFRSLGGFGLVELLIALALGLALILGISQLFVTGSRALGNASAIGRQIENAVFSIDVIAADLRLVGYWGETLSIDASADIFRPGETPSAAPVSPYPPAGLHAGPCLGLGSNYATTPVFSAKEELGWGMEYPIYAGRGTSGYGTAIPCGVSGGASPKPDSDFVTVRRASTCAAGSANCADLDATERFYVQSNGCYDPSNGIVGGETKLAKVSSVNVATSLDYQQYDPVTCSVAAPVYQYISRTYFVSSDDRLYQLNFNGVSFEQTLLVEGVEYLRFEWGRDYLPVGNPDGVVDEFVATTATTGWQEEWKDVISAKIWILVRGTEAVGGYTDGNTYTLPGGAVSLDSGELAYPRRLMSRQIELSNVVGPRR